MIALAWLSLIAMLILSLVMDLQGVTCFTFISPLPINNMPNTDIRQKISTRETAFIIHHPHTNNVMKGQKKRKSFALGVGFGGGGGGMMKKSSGGFGGGGANGGFGSNSMGTSSFG
jgi:uncharacterized membrane protein YgcG